MCNFQVGKDNGQFSRLSEHCLRPFIGSTFKPTKVIFIVRGRAQPVLVSQLWAWPWSPDSLVWSITCRGRAQPVLVSQLWAWPWSPDSLVWSTTCRGITQPVVVSQLWAWYWSPDSLMWSTECKERAYIPASQLRAWHWPQYGLKHVGVEPGQCLSASYEHDIGLLIPWQWMHWTLFPVNQRIHKSQIFRGAA